VNRVLSEQVLKYCKYRLGERCFYENCSWLDGLGNTVVCPLVSNPFGRFKKRKIGEVASANPVVLSPSKFVKRRIS